MKLISKTINEELSRCIEKGGIITDEFHAELIHRARMIEIALREWIACEDSPEEWMRCRNNAKIVLGELEN